MNKISLYNGHGFVELVDSMGDQHRIVEAARVSYNAKTKGDEQDERLLHFLFRHKHHSPLEHVVYTFRIKAPIYVARQHMRHRIGWSYNELSRRYSTSEPDAYVRRRYGDRDDPPMDVVVRDHIERSLALYREMVNDGVPSEEARDVLPMATMTEYVATTNLRALLHFYELRASEHAQMEIREVAEAMYQLAIAKRGGMAWVDKAYNLYGLGGLEALMADLWLSGVSCKEGVVAYLKRHGLGEHLIKSVLRDLGFGDD